MNRAKYSGDEVSVPGPLANQSAAEQDPGRCERKLPAAAPAKWFLKRWLFLLGGLLCLGLAVAGALLPILPCTPFVLLAVYCFARSSARMHQWLIHSRIFGGIIADWQTHRAIRRSVRSKSVLMIVVVVTLTFAIVQPTLGVGIGILSLVGIGLLVIFRLPVR